MLKWCSSPVHKFDLSRETVPLRWNHLNTSKKLAILLLDVVKKVVFVPVPELNPELDADLHREPNSHLNPDHDPDLKWPEKSDPDPKIRLWSDTLVVCECLEESYFTCLHKHKYYMFIIVTKYCRYILLMYISWVNTYASVHK